MGRKATTKDRSPEIYLYTVEYDVSDVLMETSTFSPVMNVVDCVVPPAVGAALADRRYPSNSVYSH